jgi:hypothetical protein
MRYLFISPCVFFFCFNPRTGRTPKAMVNLNLYTVFEASMAQTNNKGFRSSFNPHFFLKKGNRQKFLFYTPKDYCKGFLVKVPVVDVDEPPSTVPLTGSNTFFLIKKLHQ